MSEDVFQIITTSDINALQMRLALQCSPLLAGLKISNLLTISAKDEVGVKYLFRNSGISGRVISREDTCVRLLLYRHDELEAYIREPRVQEFMESQGYGNLQVREVLGTFTGRYKDFCRKRRDFPHEMGILLGYPIEDVRGFIENKGKNELYSGYWKVYANLTDTLELFEKFYQAREQIIRLVYVGMSITEIIQFQNRRISS